MTEVLKTFMSNMTKDVSGLIGLSVTSVDSGEPYDAYAVDPSFDIGAASAYNLEVVKAKLAAIKALGLTEEIEEIAITLDHQIHIISISPSGSYFIYLAVDSKVNLGVTRSLLRKHKKPLEAKL